MLATASSVVSLWAGGSGLNVIVVVNQNSANSVQLGNAYCELRGVPPQNLFRLTGWTNGAVQWSVADFETRLHGPLLAMLAERGLTNQIEFVLLSMDIPYTVTNDFDVNSTTSVLFYGFKTNTPAPLPCLPGGCSLPDASSNSYAFSELPFRSAPPNTTDSTPFLAMMLTASNLTAAQLILERGVASDSTFPTQTVYLAKTSDPARSVRSVEFDNALLDTRVHGDNSLIWINTDSTSFTNILGLLTGLANLSLPANAFVAGTMADSLTSYGGIIFEDSGQTSLLAFLAAGAAGSYGTVIEPCNYLEKFPDALDYFYQNRGFSLAEAYYQSILNPYQGLLSGEPLSAPFARPGAGAWTALTNGATLRSNAVLTPALSSAATNLPLGQVDLFLDGTFVKTMTNLPPTPGNVLSVTLNGITVTDAVPANATVPSVASSLAAALNTETNATRVQAWAVGDRLELQSLDIAAPGSSVTLAAGTAVGPVGQRTTLLQPARPTFLDTSATGYAGILISNVPIVGDWIELDFIKTNGAQVTVSVTNTTSNTTIATLVQALLDSVNANPALQSADGLLASDFSDDTFCGFIAAQLTLYARSPGWAAAQIQMTLTTSPNLLGLPPGTTQLEDNLNDLRPRNHLHVSSGAATVAVNDPLDTTRFPDGFHQLTAVAYEGTSVRTQTRVSRNVRFQNTTLTATFTPLLAGTSATLDMPLQFAVAANVTNIFRIELFSTGGSISVVTNEPSAVITVPSAMLGLGLHPFYALVTDSLGNQYRTETVLIRLVPSFTISLTGPTPTLSWPAIPGQQYDVMATTKLVTPFQIVTSITATGPSAQWPIPATTAAATFYRVRLSP
jgi:uncharacterized protein (TIGR03790 family)